MKKNGIKRRNYKLGNKAVPDYIQAIAAALVILIAYPLLVQSQETAEITSQEVADDMHVLFGRGGNILASIGDQGVLIVDSQFPDMVPKYRAAVESLGGGDIEFVINTHWHFDHADGNEQLGESGTWVVAHAHSRAMMTKDNTINTVVNPPVEQAAYSTAGLPVATFERRMEMHFNGQRIDLAIWRLGLAWVMQRCCFETVMSCTWGMCTTIPGIPSSMRTTVVTLWA